MIRLHSFYFAEFNLHKCKSIHSPILISVSALGKKKCRASWYCPFPMSSFEIYIKAKRVSDLQGPFLPLQQNEKNKKQNKTQKTFFRDGTATSGGRIFILLFSHLCPNICNPLDSTSPDFLFLFFFFFFLFSGFCHTLKWISHGFKCVPHPDPPSHLPLHPIPLGLPSAPGPSACLMHPTWAGDLFHPR